jgi:dolichyl-phosphate beta-glucosyltransferase
MIVPFFNESKRWREEYWSAATSLQDIDWIFVNDGSIDDTKSLIDTFCSGRQNVCALHIGENAGKAEAVRAGMLKAFNEPCEDLLGIGFIDADGAFTISDIERVTQIFSSKMQEQVGFDAVWTARIALAGRNVTRSSFRHYVGRIIATIIGLNFPESPYDTQSGFKIFAASQSMKQQLFSPFKTRWLFDVEILLRWHSQNSKSMKIWEEPLHAWSDIAGSKVTLLQTAKIVRELLFINKLKKSIPTSKKAS